MAAISGLGAILDFTDQKPLQALAQKRLQALALGKRHELLFDVQQRTKRRHLL